MVALYSASTLYLWLLRLYTLATMYIPPIRRRMQQYHANMAFRFYNTWKESHPTRMAKALRQEGEANQQTEIHVVHLPWLLHLNTD